jgi:glycine betaine/choline ABC-type transport system substrate-binding protein
MFSRIKTWSAGLVALTLIVPLLAGCDIGGTGGGGGGTATKPNIIVSSKDFTEEILVGEMYAQLLEQAGYPVTRKLLLGASDIAQAFSTDGAIGGNDLVVLEDDKHLFPVYQIAPVIRDDILTANPDIKGVLNALAPKLTNDAVAKINWEVDGKKREPKDVATEFLKNNGLLK